MEHHSTEHILSVGLCCWLTGMVLWSVVGWGGAEVNLIRFLLLLQVPLNSILDGAKREHST